MRRGGRNKSVLEWILLKKRKLQQGRNEGKSQKKHEKQKKKIGENENKYGRYVGAYCTRLG